MQELRARRCRRRCASQGLCVSSVHSSHSSHTDRVQEKAVCCCSLEENKHVVDELHLCGLSLSRVQSSDCDPSSTRHTHTQIK
ncbi:hypothetical protein PGIGA_G00242460 [Pangasianodon gigas]|uniref:Uncharacterized protein n=1 Tax=Pangasianodon gigas TaxID=30993 RepID=A0ACC5WNJ2_PANGG|nr:hypothetical protein [Pangasianodon gigas]